MSMSGLAKVALDTGFRPWRPDTNRSIIQQMVAGEDCGSNPRVPVFICLFICSFKKCLSDTF